MPSEQRGEETISAGIRIVAARGVAAATTRAIASEAGMPLGASHYVFTSHDELMRAVIDNVMERERLAAETSWLDSTAVEAAIRSGLDAYIDLLEADPQRELALLELAVFARRQDEHGRMRDQYRSYDEAASVLLRSAAAAASSMWTAPLEELARHLVAVVDGITTTWPADHATETARKTAAFAAAAFAASAAPRPTAEEGRSDLDFDRTRRPSSDSLDGRHSTAGRNRQLHAPAA
ncbi:TetR/AcrR family transcriptional regulator [Streptomyces sp. TLI_105]|uniref:TetR/AcrR family transcriptional regulator n=1 Tax=Streptomyces sp. TLI_105 TaxID=1881019 RepID=UPI0008956A95|nr:TetR family transcriptional regulator [Streptomyces sp. TLI_105]SEB62204.1 transcriptional regulator, TetR family [Streptomyces sp. TLI_105]